MSKEELQQLEYEDALILLFSTCQQYGARRVFQDFRAAFPDMFEEVVVQINRFDKDDRLPALLR